VPYFFKQWGEYAEVPPAEESDPLAVQISGPLHVCCDGKPFAMARYGKKAAGRLLDGRKWNKYPEAA
jgi:hypothetical protein